MSIIKFTLNEHHIALIKNINWESINFPFMPSQDLNENSPFGGDNLGYDVGVILFGRGDATIEPSSEMVLDYTDDEKKILKETYEGLPQALSIVCQTGKMEPGTYQTSNYIRDWVRIDE